MTKNIEADELPDAAVITDQDAPRDQKKDEAMLQLIVKRAQVHDTFWSEIHAEAREDDQFVAGKQWPENIERERAEAGRPCLTYNLIPSFHRIITNRIRQENPQVKVVPVEVDRRVKTQRVKNITGNKDYSMADIYGGIWRNIEHRSQASQAYDTAIEHAVDHGFGFLYLVNEWSPTDPFVQSLTVYRIRNSYTVTLDPGAQQADWNDAQDAFIRSKLRRDVFEAKYPKASAGMNFDTAGGMYDGWWDQDTVTIAQYFHRKWVDDVALLMSNGATHYQSDVEDVLDDMETEYGIYVVTEKAVRRPKVHWYKTTGSDILADQELPFSRVPVFIVTGKEMILEGKTHLESACRHAKDAQRSYNYWRTAAAETVALSPKIPYVISAGQIKGWEHLWKRVNQDNLPYVVYNHEDNNPNPPQRNYPSQVAAAELANATQDARDMQTIMGLHDANLGRESNEKSGRAIDSRKEAGFTSTFQFPDNLTRAQVAMVRCALEAIQRIYDTPRIERIRLPDGTDDFVEINKTVVDKATGKKVLVHDIAYGDYDCVLEPSVNYATQREEMAQFQLDLLKLLGPDRANNVAHIIVRNLAGPGSEEIAAVLRKMLPDALKSADEREADLPAGVTMNEQGQPVNEDGSPYQPPPTIDQQIQQKAQEISQLKYEAEKLKHQATMAKADADKEKAKAEQAETQAKIGELQGQINDLKAAKDAGDNMPAIDYGEIEKIVRGVMKEHEANPKAHQAVIEKDIEDAVVTILQRVKAYVDKQAAKFPEFPPDKDMRTRQPAEEAPESDDEETTEQA